MRHLLSVLFLLFIHHSFTQGLYVDMSGGYQYALNQEQPPTYMINSHHGITCPGFWKKEDPSFKHILNSRLGVGYEFNKNIALEISGSYLQTKLEQKRAISTKRIVEGNFYRITPSIVLNLPLDKIELYSKIGVSVVGGDILFSLRYKGEDPSYSFEEIKLDYKFKGPASIGFRTVIGSRKNITNFLQVFAEIEFAYQNFSPDKGYTRRYEFDGQDQLDLYNYDTRDTEIDFVDEQAFSGYQIMEDDVPEKMYRRNYSLSGIAFNLGVRFYIWSKIETEE